MRARLFSMMVLSSAATATAMPLIYEPFNYDATGNPELHTVNPEYAKINNNNTDAPRVMSGSLNYSGLPVAPSGNSLKIDGTFPTSSVTRPLPGQPYHVSSNPTVYWSAILKVNTIVGTDFNTAGSFVAGFRSTTSTGLIANGEVGAPLLIVSDNVERTAYRIGTARTAAGADRQFDTLTYTTDDVLFLVFAYQLHSGNNVARMWVNPDPYLSEAQNSSALRMEVNTGTTITNGRITNFFFRNNQAEPDDLQLDELRVALTWESVVGLLEGDFNRDGLINSTDRTLLHTGFSQQLSGYENGDMNRDGVINFDDLALFDRALARYSPPGGDVFASSVPEPGVAALLGLLVSGVLRRRAR